MHYYCTCSSRNRGDVTKGKTPYRKVEVDKEGICLDCKHYAIASRVELINAKDLYNYLFNREPLKNLWALPEKGGLSIGAQSKDNEEYRRYMRNYRLKNKDKHKESE